MGLESGSPLQVVLDRILTDILVVINHKVSEDTNHKVLVDTLGVTNRVNALTITVTIIIIIMSITVMNTDTATEVINQFHPIGILEFNLVSTRVDNLVSILVDNPTDPTSPNAQLTQIVQTIHNVLLIPTLKNQPIQVQSTRNQ
uniref:(northern house mosquito) hypothetical protein n=1 Tax=Culex pipiens TaxID=7175 RepID=A0A8D8BSE6_CULPI